MTNRTCIKCGDSLVVNDKLNLMECVSGKHLEPINTVRAQWWNQCPDCGQMGTNDKDAEAKFQVIEVVKEEVDGELINVKKPVTRKVGDKDFALVFEENKSQVPVKCKACGLVFTKISALN